MRKLLLTAILAVAPSLAMAQSIPSWKSYQQTGNPADIVPSAGTPNSVAQWMGKKVDVAGGTSTNQLITTPTINEPMITNGSLSGTIIDKGLATAANSIAVGTKARTQSERAMSMPQPADFLSATQEVSDLLSGKLDVAPLINAAFSAGVKTIFLPCGTYSVQSQIAFTSAYQAIRGSGACTNLSIDSAGIIAILNQGLSDISISDLGITSSVTRTAPDIKAYNSFRMMISHVIWHEGSGSASNPLLLDGANDTHITDSEMHSTSETGYGIQITGTSQRTEDTYISNTNIYGFQNGLEINWSSGLYASGMDILNNSIYGVDFNPSSTQEIDGTRMSRVLSDTNNSNGFEFRGAGNITETALTNCWASSNGHYNGNSTVNAAGLSIDNANTNNISIIASEFHSNTASGVAVEAGSNIIISGNAFFMNGTNGITNATATGNAYSGLLIDTNASHVVANGNIGGLGGVENAGTTNHQQYLINNQSANYVTMVGNMGNSNWGNLPVYTATTTNVVNANNNGN